MSVVSVVPWYNAEQFIKVYEYLFSDEVEKKRWAYDTISVWESRCHPSLPTAIEATYVLTSAVIQDILWSNNASLLHHIDIQGIYGSAIIRFVSLSVEVNKKENVPTYSITEVAKLIGIPSFIVQIRNELCHSVRPSLSVLRRAVQAALTYLRESYWEKEIAHLKNHVKEPLDGTGIYDKLQEFIQFQYDVMLSKKEKVIKSDNASEVNPEYGYVLQMLERAFKNNKRHFVQVLVSDGVFIPSDEEFKSKVSKEEYKIFEDDSDLDYSELDENMCEENGDRFDLFESKYLPDIPKYHEMVWEQVIALFNKYDAVPMFMEALLKTQGNRTIIGQKLLIAWILKILDLNSTMECGAKKCLLKKIFRRKAFVANWLSILYSAVVNPCKYTLTILPRILHNLNIEKVAMHAIVGLTSLKLGLAEVKKPGQYFRFFHTVDDLKGVLEYQKVKEKKAAKKAENIWSSCPDDCYKSWPIGSIINMIKEEDDEMDSNDLERMDIKQEIPSEDDDILEFPDNFQPEKEEEDDDDVDDIQTNKMNEEIKLEKILKAIKNRDNLLYIR